MTTTTSKSNSRSVLGGASSSRGQAAVEILVYIGFFLLVFVVVSLFFVLQVGQDISQRQYRLAQSTAGQLADDLQMALQAGPGFNATFTLPARLNGFTYAARFYGSSMYVEMDSTPPSRFYYPIGIFANPLSPDSSLRCDNDPGGKPGNPLPAPGTQPCSKDANGWWYNLTSAGGQMRIVNAVDSNGQPQLQIHPVN